MNTTVIGLGNLGRLYAGAALKSGDSVTPVNRGTDVLKALRSSKAGDPILIAVGEGSLADVCSAIPDSRCGDVVLVQNGVARPKMGELGVGVGTLAVVWTLEKAAMPRIESLPMGASGPHAEWLAAICDAIGLRTNVMDSLLEEHVEAAAKHAFILTINALGLVEPRTVGQWNDTDPRYVASLTAECASIAGPMLGVEADLDRVTKKVRAGMTGFQALPCRGRTAAARVRGILSFAAFSGRELPLIDEIANLHR